VSIPAPPPNPSPSADVSDRFSSRTLSRAEPWLVTQKQIFTLLDVGPFLKILRVVAKLLPHIVGVFFTCCQILPNAMQCKNQKFTYVNNHDMKIPLELRLANIVLSVFMDSFWPTGSWTQVPGPQADRQTDKRSGQTEGRTDGTDRRIGPTDQFTRDNRFPLRMGLLEFEAT
jgi:hypothetical protein